MFADRKHDSYRPPLVLLASALATAAGMALTSLILTWVLVNWVTGCGETFPTVGGGVEPGACVAMPFGVDQ